MLLPQLIVSSKPNVMDLRLALYLHYDSFELEWVVSVVVILYWYAGFFSLSLNKVCSQKSERERHPFGLRINFQRKTVFLRD